MRSNDKDNVKSNDTPAESNEQLLWKLDKKEDRKQGPRNRS
jgi:hypothetical protein